MRGPEGIVNLLKPPGMTSSNAVTDLRRLFHVKRVGHTGTLDPGAAGVLPVCVGRATRLFDILVDKEKEYIGEIRFGARTDTQDSYGNVIETGPADVSREALAAILPEFLGRQRQIPPMYSALKQNGRTLHSLARQGQEVERAAREIAIHELALLPDPERFLLRIRCSRGTYVRTLMEDIGRRLDRCAHMAFLLRTGAGPFRIEDSLSIGELTALAEENRLMEALIPMERALAFLPALRLDPGEDGPLRHGMALPVQDGPAGLCRLYCGEIFLGVGEEQAGLIRLRLHLYDDDPNHD